jgi:hypothetical protein
MKTKILAFGVLISVGWVVSAGDAAAFHCLPRCCQDEANGCCRPYNAFSPVCCTPHHGHHFHHRAGTCPYCHGISCPPWICGGPFPMSGDPCAGGFAGAPTNMLPGSTTVTPETSNPGFVPPPPTPTPMPIVNQTSMPWAPPSPFGLQPAAYQQGQYPSYPVNYYPASSYPAAVPTSVPYYWYNNGR